MSRLTGADTLEGDQFNPVAPDIALALSNAEVLRGGHDRVTEADLCVWPPILLGTRDRRAPNLFFNASGCSLCCFTELELPKLDPITCGKDSNEIRLLYIFPPSKAGFFEARRLDQDWTKEDYLSTFREAGWKLSSATVKDMVDIDPHRKLVDWIPLCSSTEVDLSRVSSSQSPTESFNMEYKIGMSPLPFNKDLQATLGDLKGAESSLKLSIEKGMNVGRFISKIETYVTKPLEDSLTDIKKRLACIKERNLELRRLFAFDGSHVAKKSSERLSSLREPKAAPDVEVTEKAKNIFKSKIINRGAELELNTLQSLVAGFRRASGDENDLTQLYQGHIFYAKYLAEQQRVVVLEHLKEIQAETEDVLEKGLLSRVKFVKSMRRNEEESSVLTKFLCTGPIEIAEQIHISAVQDRELQHAREKEVLKTANKEYANKLAFMNNEVAKLSEGLKELTEAQSNHECCVCYNALEGFSLSSGPGESSSSKKLFKRACLLPCMHANVCISCSEKRWIEGPQNCPMCREELTEKPRIIYL